MVSSQDGSMSSVTQSCRSQNRCSLRNGTTVSPVLSGTSQEWIFWVYKAANICVRPPANTDWPAGAGLLLKKCFQGLTWIDIFIISRKLITHAVIPRVPTLEVESLCTASTEVTQARCCSGAGLQTTERLAIEHHPPDLWQVSRRPNDLPVFS